MEAFEAKIFELKAKGIRPTDIAKIYDLDKKDVLSVIFKKEKSDKEAAKKKSTIEKIMQIAKVEEAIAEKVFAAVKELI